MFLEKPSHENFEPIILFTKDEVELWTEENCEDMLTDFYDLMWFKKPWKLRNYYQWTRLNQSNKHMYIWTTQIDITFLALIKKTLWNNYAWYNYLLRCLK